MSTDPSAPTTEPQAKWVRDSATPLPPVPRIPASKLTLPCGRKVLVEWWNYTHSWNISMVPNVYVEAPPGRIDVAETDGIPLLIAHLEQILSELRAMTCDAPAQQSRSAIHGSPSCLTATYRPATTLR